MERSAIICSLVMLGWMVAVGSSTGAKDVVTYWGDYNVEGIDWDLSKTRAYCSQFPEYTQKPYQWRSKYYWAAFCGPAGPLPPLSCGRCLKVTNSRNKNYSVTVRIVDRCYNFGIMVLDGPAFAEIDFDRQGYRLGHLSADYEFVDCDDPEIRLNTGL